MLSRQYLRSPTRNQTGGNFAMHVRIYPRLHHGDPGETKKPRLGEAVRPANWPSDICLDRRGPAEARRRRLPGSSVQHFPCSAQNRTKLPPRSSATSWRTGFAGVSQFVLRMVYQVGEAVKIPIIGIGGVTNARIPWSNYARGWRACGRLGYAVLRIALALDPSSLDDPKPGATPAGIQLVLTE